MPKNSIRNGSFMTLLLFILVLTANSQIAYSPVIDSLITLSTQQTNGLTVRQLSGDTSILLDGSAQLITSRNYQFNSVQNIAAQFIKEKFEEYGLNARYQDYSATGRNVLGWKTGNKFPEKKYIICAHYDNMPTSLFAPGADDNASGVVAVMEAARILGNLPSEYTLEFAVWDEEEIGLVGSQAYADSAVIENAQIMGVLNFDMIAWDSNNDYKMTIGTNSLSASLSNDYETVMNLYTPEIWWNYTTIEASDHASFWNVGYPALLGIEEYPDDFNAYYHTPEDNFSHLNMPYFTRMVQAGIAGLATLGWNCRMNLLHQPVNSGTDTSAQMVTLRIQSPRTISYDDNKPRLYYKVNEGNFEYLHPINVTGTDYSFELPGQPYGSTVSYYFAVQDQDNLIIETLPKGGRGISPPGTQAPAQTYTYLVAPNQVQTFCSATLPKTIPDMSSVYDTIFVSNEGGIKDLDVSLTITHTRVKTLNITLTGPDGTVIDLSSGNGGSGSNFTNTIFDDEATISIVNGTAPYTGRFRPEQPLSTLDTRSIYGNWILRVQDSVISQAGTLNNWCLTLDYYDLNAPVTEKLIAHAPMLGQNYPNPVRSGQTHIPFHLNTDGKVVFHLYDLYGRLVHTFGEGHYTVGDHHITVDLSHLPSGMYTYKILFGSGTESKLMMITQ